MYCWKLSSGEICLANFIPPGNGASQGNYFLSKSHKSAISEAKMGFQKQLWQPNVQNVLCFFVLVHFLYRWTNVSLFVFMNIPDFSGVC